MFPDINALVGDSSHSKNGIVNGNVGGCMITFLIDSGAMVNAITPEAYRHLINSNAFIFNADFNPVLELRAFASESSLVVSVRFQAKLTVLFHGDSLETDPVQVEEFYVIEKAKRCLLSRKTSEEHNLLALGQEVRRLRSIRPFNNELDKSENGWSEINLVEPGVFEPFEMEPVILKIRKEVMATKIRYTNVPFNMRDEARAQIKGLEEQGIIREVKNYSDISWISSMIPVVKANGKLRLVVDLRGPNKAIVRESYRMPTIEQVTSRLAGCEFFSTIDLTNAFYHVPLDENSKYLTTFWTGEKYYQFNRLPFGLVNAPDIFQRALQDLVLRDCDNTLNYLDDILIFTRTEIQHDISYANVIKKLLKHNVKLNLEKCKIKQQSVIFLGFKISGQGMAISQDKFQAFVNLREPKSISEVKSYLGMLTFLERFIVNRANKTKHLRAIVNSGQFMWTQDAQKEFDNIRTTELNSIANLSFYNEEWETELFVDASPTGLGAILAQFERKTNGNKKPEKLLHIVCCASRALTPVEQRYPQQHREALAIGINREILSKENIKNIAESQTLN